MASRNCLSSTKYSKGSKQPNKRSGHEVDILAELRLHLERMREEPLSEWEPEAKKLAVIAFKQVCQYVAGESQILISTNNNLASNICSQHFESDSKAAFLIRDEDTTELEVNGWIPLTSCKFSPKITGIVLGATSCN
ncbi:hypothetical protein Asppvi_001125 [Aspergillus pseudoviridinutans]|uniref:Uncharacterized protein n=1 Tax=Aspergillus pseudoviridinutans TaxID=1517512 RepID=A0A9P3EPC0_9EURO|nr:uncharacterized protein Asppvi_001125 [Aspergillus pseudoviridinutans]GIJ82616.1 hypothetical protein Asppvi_001125 [Aspergillus pseudoviridinutans]